MEELYIKFSFIDGNLTDHLYLQFLQKAATHMIVKFIENNAFDLDCDPIIQQTFYIPVRKYLDQELPVRLIGCRGYTE